MKNVIVWLQGKKFHILMVAMVVLIVYAGADTPEGFDPSNLTVENLQAAVVAMAISAVKAAWDRRAPK
jgi:hypothetical protein